MFEGNQIKIKENLALISENERNIIIWNFEDRKELFRSSTNLVFGSNNADFSISKNLICICTEEGIELIDFIKSITLFKFKYPELRWCKFSNIDQDLIFLGGYNDIFKFSISERRIIGSITNTHYVFEDIENSNLLFSFKKDIALLGKNEKIIWKDRLKGFALLDAVFYQDNVCISEASKGIRLYSLTEKKFRWEFVEVDTIHFIYLFYSKIMKKNIGVGWNYEKGGSKKAYLLNEEGMVINIFDIGMGKSFSLLMDKFLLSANGELYDLEKGVMKEKLVW